MLKDSRVTENGYYVPTVTQPDGTVKEAGFDTRSNGF